MTNYANGAAFEREVKVDLEKNKWFAVRSAGSRGAVDVVAVSGGLTTIVLFIQCKRDGVLSSEERKALVELATMHGAIPVLAEKRQRGKTVYWRLAQTEERLNQIYGLREY